MTPPFDVVLRRGAAQAAGNLARRQRHAIEAFLDHLASHPATPGDFQERDATGRMHQSTLIEEAVVTWWVDDAAREIRVVEIEAIDPAGR